MTDQPKLNPLMVYHYIYQTCIRWQIAFGVTKGRYVQWKARLPLIALELWWVLIVVIWTQILLENKWFFSRSRLMIPLTVGVIVLIDQYVFSMKDAQKAYEEMFHAWPKKKRRNWDLCVAAFMILTPVVFVFSGMAADALLR